MTTYPDTSFLFALYRFQQNSPIAAEYFKGMNEPLNVASPILFEFRQSMRFQAYLNSQDPSKGFDRKIASRALATFQSNIRAGALVVTPIEWPEVVNVAERLSMQHTWDGGYRAFDILHVATALHLGVREFLTFDMRQSELAASEGLDVPLIRTD